MGNCASGQKKKRKGDSASADKSKDNKPNEDVTYASINHTNVLQSRRAITTSDNDCDYATVNVPAALLAEVESESSSKEECADDYVLMG
ncbi:uncharacterized protein PAE49_013625 [Odontesthes bonariensis]|uniref:uncharacterized protein LOC142396139 n=1 Tax=Odontesthes bonariensis TaxID=219752 RepID=UPI003F584071